MMVSDGSGIQSCYFYPNFLPPKLVDFEFPVLGYASLLMCVFATFKSPSWKNMLQQTIPPCWPDASNSRNQHQRPTSSTIGNPSSHPGTFVYILLLSGTAWRSIHKWHWKTWKCQCLTLWHLLMSKSLAPLFDEQSSRVQKLFHVPFPRIQSLRRSLSLLTFSKVLHLAKQFQRTKAYPSFTANQYVGNM